VQLYEANHLYLMKIALIKKNLQEKNTTSRYHPSVMKTTYHIKSAKKVPNSPLDGAQYEKHLIK
jgi:hypothetical protein